jgi:hypothetical protein
MWGATEIYTALNVTAITNLLDSFKTGKALFNDSLIPEAFTGKKSINFYLISPIIGASELEEYEYSVNCRADTFGKSLNLAYNVHEALNRVHGVDSFTLSSVLQTIPPQDSTDVYNTPISIKLKMR